MPHFRDAQGNLHFVEREFAHLLPPGCVEISDAEAEALRAPLPPAVADYTAAVQCHLDAAARARGYDGILSACSYDGDPDPGFAAEAAAFKAWRSAVWRYGYAQLDAVQAGQRPQPTVAELIAELPAPVLP